MTSPGNLGKSKDKDSPRIVHVEILGMNFIVEGHPGFLGLLRLQSHTPFTPVQFEVRDIFSDPIVVSIPELEMRKSIGGTWIANIRRCFQDTSSVTGRFLLVTGPITQCQRHWDFL